MEILAVLFFLVVAGGAFFTLIFFVVFLPYWIGAQLWEVIKFDPKKNLE